MIEEMHTKGLDVTVFFYNPNIHPRKDFGCIIPRLQSIPGSKGPL